VIAALVQYQLNRDGTLQTRQRLLIALQAEIADFQTKEPKAYEECEAVCEKLFEKTMKEEQRIKALSPDAWEVQKLVEVWKERWSEIEITDIPDGSGRPGRYKFTESDVYSLSDREVANQSLIETLGESRNRGTSPEYWIRLGHLVMLREKKYGRCLNCASAVIHSLITDPHYNDFLIEHVAAPESDHHFVLIGRPNADGRTENGLEDKYAWQHCAVIDVWDGNLPSSAKDGVHQYVKKASDCGYAQKKMQLFAAFRPDQRREHLQLISDLYDDPRFTPRTRLLPQDDAPASALAREAHLAEMLAHTPGESRTMKVDGGWVVQEKGADGNWVTVESAKSAVSPNFEKRKVPPPLKSRSPSTKEESDSE